MLGVVIAVVVVGGIFLAALFVVRSQILSKMTTDLANFSVRTANEQASVASSLAQLTAGLARVSDLAVVQQQTAQLTQDAVVFRENLEATVANIKRIMSEERDAFEKRIVMRLEEEVGSRAAQHIESHGVPRGEFDRLRTRVDRLVGAEELAERVELARSLFESSDLRVMTWQCKVIRMLDGGLAPDAEEDAMAAAGIPLTAARSYLKKLQELDVVSSKKVTSYWVAPDYQWLLVAAEDANAIRARIDTFTRNEQEYQAHVVARLADIEPGLVLVAEQWELPTGKVDVKARDMRGVDVFIELKYPAASSSAYAQILKYRQDIVSEVGASPARFLLVAPKVSQRVRDLLGRDGIEWKEVPY